VVPWSNDAMVGLGTKRGRGAVFVRPRLPYPPLNHGTADRRTMGGVTCVGNRVRSLCDLECAMVPWSCGEMVNSVHAALAF
jgi:hypothetical protein